jgi:Xaa-Pro dipeptidase
VTRKGAALVNTAFITPKPPIDVDRLDTLMDEAGLDALLVSSPHNLRYLLGGYAFPILENITQLGATRYTPLLGYVRGRPDLTFYVGWSAEAGYLEQMNVWVPTTVATTWNQGVAAQQAAEEMKSRVDRHARIGLELPFLSAEIYKAITDLLPSAQFASAIHTLDWLRAVKSSSELDQIRTGVERSVDALIATLTELVPGQTKMDTVETLRREHTSRGLVFGYCLIAVSPVLDRFPTNQPVTRGTSVSLDSAAVHDGYIVDVSRMGVIGEPSETQRELLTMLTEVHQAARDVIRGGVRGGDVVEAAEQAVRALPSPELFYPEVHGMGLCHHEAPRIHNKAGPLLAPDHDRLLEPGMALSIEVDVKHPDVGLIKLEDVVFVTPTGHELVGDLGRDWIQASGDFPRHPLQSVAGI